MQKSLAVLFSKMSYFMDKYAKEYRKMLLTNFSIFGKERVKLSKQLLF